MKLPGPLNPQQEKQLDTVQASARHLLSLIDDLLDVASIESGKMQVRPQSVACQSIIREVIDTLHAAADGKGLRLEAKVPSDDVVVQCDPRMLYQILLNLTHNAIKFTSAGGVTISLCQKLQGGQLAIEITVTDTGVGIREEDQASLFQAFSQIGASSMRRGEGSGLGLHVSQRLAAMIGGHIDVKSEFGKGSAFTLQLRGESPDQAGIL
jgi:protein-histidine pros-kinase